MAVITISRGTFSGGKMLAEQVSCALGYRCIDRDALVKKAARRGISEYDLRAALEEPPEFPGTLNHKRYIYFALLQAALAEETRGGNAVYHGLAGHLLLKGAPGVLRLRIIAPLEFRIEMAHQRLQLSREEARTYIEEQDRERRRWTRYLYGVDWSDPSLYDVVINLEQMSIEQACRLVVSATEQGGFEEAPEQEATRNDFALASRVRADLALDVYTLDLEVEVACRDGDVSIRGNFPAQEMEAIRRVALAAPGVTGVTVNPGK